VGLVTALLLSIAMIVAIRYFPWKPLAGRDLPGALLYLLNLMALLVPMTGVFTDPGSATTPWTSPEALPMAASWVIILWAFALADLVTLYLLTLLDMWLAVRHRLSASENEGQILRDTLP